MDGGNDHGYTPALDGYEAYEPMLGRPLPSAGAAVRSPRATLRFGGLSMDTITGAVTYRGAAVKLSVHERELLGAMLRRAGQIVSREQLATAIGSTEKLVDERTASLRASLKQASAPIIPCEVNGLGYILWRC